MGPGGERAGRRSRAGRDRLERTGGHPGPRLRYPDGSFWHADLEIGGSFYGNRHGGVKDPAGNSWWIATHIEDVSPEELARRGKAAAEERKKG